ncbi:cilia- and flagella-associated protein 141-like [Spea bombifrons]|uniref:cilia- and flagella-associated protein 141-like n=1 Tax=Spea bombifrons TaxID=233779 RepID=UPI00234A37F3|nr:cilia- and flagella-associated protein 141-like [Spea bombifrons]
MLPSRIRQALDRTRQEDERLQRLEKERSREQTDALRCEWTEGHGAANTARQRGQMAQELQMANRQLVMVRRAALQHLLQQEKCRHQEELRRLGKSLQTQRL